MDGVKRCVVVLAVAALGCGGNVLAPGEVPYGQPFDLKVGESARVGDDRVGVTFEAVKSDSRCPIDAICITAGEAVVALRFSVDGRTLAKEMGTEQGKSEVVLDRVTGSTWCHCNPIHAPTGPPLPVTTWRGCGSTPGSARLPLPPGRCPRRRSH